MATKKTIVLLISLLFSICGYAQDIEITKLPEYPTSEDSIRFFEKIKSVRETSYGVAEKFGEISKERINYIKIYKCDRKKNLTEYGYDDGYNDKKAIIKYNDNGGKTEKKTYTNEKLDSIIVWKYDNKGNIIEKNNYGSDKVLFSKIKWKYNDKNKCIEKSKYDSLGNAVLREIRDFDTEGYYTGHAEYENGKLKWKCTHKFDDRGNLTDDVRVAYCDSDIDTLWIRKLKYDEFDNWTEFDEFQKHNQFQLSRKKFTRHDRDKVKIEARDFYWNNWDYDKKYEIFCSSKFYFYNSNGELKMAYGCGSDYWWYNKYDVKGNLIEYLQKKNDECRTPIIKDKKTFKYSEEEVRKMEKEIENMKEFDVKTQYVYTFDECDNWITKTTYQQKLNSLPICINVIEREIEYYDPY